MPPSSSPQILVVEDNDFVRMQTAKYLEEAGFAVKEVGLAQEALETISPKTDLVVLDVRMEPMDGFEFIRKIRSLGMETPVILMTGDQNPDMLSEAAKWGIRAVLMKPVQKDRLIRAVTKTLAIKDRLD